MLAGLRDVVDVELVRRRDVDRVQRRVLAQIGHGFVRPPTEIGFELRACGWAGVGGISMNPRPKPATPSRSCALMVPASDLMRLERGRVEQFLRLQQPGRKPLGMMAFQEAAQHQPIGL